MGIKYLEPYGFKPINENEAILITENGKEIKASYYDYTKKVQLSINGEDLFEEMPLYDYSYANGIYNRLLSYLNNL